jgi:hypothetical protein
MAELLTQIGDMVPDQDENECLHLSYGERMIGFGICAVCGALAGVLAVLSLTILNLRKFAVLFTVSTVLFVVALGLLIGFRRILKSSMERKRIISASGLVGGMLLTLFFGVVKRFLILSIASFVVEILSFLYFALSYIPGGDRLFHMILF